MKTILALVLCLLALPATHAEETSKDLVQLANLTRSAFLGEYYAQEIGDKKLAEKLMRLGFTSGLKFRLALREKKIDASDYDAEVPIEFKLQSEGPTDEFVMGRWYQFCFQTVQATYASRGEKDQKEVARSELRRMNAAALVKDIQLPSE